MPPPSPPYVDIKTGFSNPPNMVITAGESFYWYNSNPMGGLNCTVMISGSWCNASSYGPIQPQGSAPATVKATTPTGTYNWSSGCCLVAQPVHVHGTRPRKKKKKKTAKKTINKKSKPTKKKKKKANKK
jgi:hypothetical protein